MEDARAATVEHDGSLAAPAPWILRSDVCAALIGILSDGRRHDVDTLTRRLSGSIGDRPHVVDTIDALRDQGMALVRDDHAVEARAFAPLDRAPIARALPGWTVDVVGSIASTNSALLQRLRSDGHGIAPALLASEVQTAGRGRLGRRWTSAPGASLTASFALQVGRPLALLDGITLVCGLAVHDALAAHGVTAALKWPNDLLVDGRKLAGILVETHARDGCSTIVVGVGVNVSAREHVEAGARALPPVDFVGCGGCTADRNVLVAAIARALATRVARFEADGFIPFVDEWNACDAFHDRAVVLQATDPALVDRARTGIARGVDRRGALLLDVGDAVVPVVSGELSLRPLIR